MFKRGLSDVVATVIIIALVIVAIAVVWLGVMPLIKDKMGSSDVCNSVDVSIESSQGYTCWAKDQNLTLVQIKKGSSDTDVSKIKFAISYSGNSISYTNTTSLQKNSFAVFYLNTTGVSGIDKIEAVPFVKTGNNEKACSAVFVENLKSCGPTALSPTEVQQIISSGGVMNQDTTRVNGNDEEVVNPPKQVVLPKINILSPINNSVSTSSTISLNVSSDQAVNWFYFNGSANVSFVPNISVYNLYNANYNWIIYANNSNGIGSAVVNFSVNVPGIQVSACREISSPGIYVLRNDVSSSGACFTISVDNVVLDGNGKTITYDTLSGNSLSGIWILGNRNNITIKNTKITAFAERVAETDIFVEGDLTNSFILNNTLILAFSPVDGIWFNGKSINNTISNNNISGVGSGISFSSTSLNNKISNNYIESSWHDIVYDFWDTTYDNSGATTVGGLASNDIISNNILKCTNPNYAAIIYGFFNGNFSSSNVTIFNNSINSIAGGILFSIAVGNNISDNTIFSPSGVGINFYRLVNYSVINNFINNNNLTTGYDGIDFRKSANNSLNKNYITAGWDGVWFKYSSLNDSYLNNYIVDLDGYAINSEVGTYSNNIIRYSNSYGEIGWVGSRWIIEGNILWDGGVTGEIQIKNNFVFVNKTIVPELNFSANITLYGIVSGTVIKKNGVNCGSECYNFTPLNAGTVRFNVSYAGANYSIV